MLNGIAPLIIFNFYEALPQLDVSGVPLLNLVTDKIPLVPIPIYLDEKITGIYIQNEDKHIDVDTQVQPSVSETSAADVKVTQRGINSSVTISMLARTDAPLVSILISMADMIFDRVAKNAYNVTYINKSIIIFSGLVQNFTCVQNKNTDLYEMSLTISKATGTSTVAKAAAPTITNTAENSSLANAQGPSGL